VHPFDAEEARDALVRLVGRPVGCNAEGHVLVRCPAMRCVSEGMRPRLRSRRTPKRLPPVAGEDRARLTSTFETAQRAAADIRPAPIESFIGSSSAVVEAMRYSAGAILFAWQRR
jgi:hypothetical protein